MKTKQPKPVSLIECGKDEWESTNEYRIKVDRIVKEVTDKYSEALLNERNWFKRLLIKVRIELETRKRINGLSSMKNLHATDNPGILSPGNY